MSRKFGTISVLVGAFMVLTASAALAADGQSAGNGKTNANASFGFNAQEDLSGNFEYHSAGGGLEIHCNDYYSYKEGTVTNAQGDTFPKVTVRSSTCEDNDGNTYFVRAEFVDRGEGANAPQDGACILISPTKNVAQDAIVTDCGKIRRGNIQIIHSS